MTMFFFEPLRPKKQPPPAIGKRIRIVVENGLPDMLEGTVTRMDGEICTFRLNKKEPYPVSPEYTDLETRKAVMDQEGEYSVPLSYLWAVES